MGQIVQYMNQVWLPLERSQPDLRLWSLNVVASLHREDKKQSALRGVDLGICGRFYAHLWSKHDQI